MLFALGDGYIATDGGHITTPRKKRFRIVVDKILYFLKYTVLCDFDFRGGSFIGAIAIDGNALGKLGKLLFIGDALGIEKVGF
jgi:hypothetical protein